MVFYFDAVGIFNDAVNLGVAHHMCCKIFKQFYKVSDWKLSKNKKQKTSGIVWEIP